MGVVPVENSTNGSVEPVFDLFADRSNLYPDIILDGEIYLHVHHCLLGYGTPYSTNHSPVPTPPNIVSTQVRPRATPLANLSSIRRIYSHPKAFGQCEIFLGSYLKGIERIDVSSTSKAAELVKADISGTSVAIASQVASDIHRLTVLAKAIEDSDDNTTRFFILKRRTDASKVDPSELRETTSQSKSLISFAVDHKAPGALTKVLDCFGRYNLNLTSFNQRPGRIEPFQYIFFVEFEGSKLYDPEGNVNEALQDVQKVTKSYRWWGSWEDKYKQYSLESW